MILNHSNKNPLYSKVYALWHSMIQRCYYEKNASYKNYGKRGVYVCDKWLDIDGFIEDIDLIDGYDEQLLVNGFLELDKDIKVMHNMVYSLETCCFVSSSENSGRRRNNKLNIFIHLEKEMVVIGYNREKFCRDNDLDSSTVWRMLQKTSNKNINRRAPNVYKGWTAFYAENFNMELLPKKVIYFAKKDNKYYTFTNKRNFAKEMGLNNNLITACLKGRQNKTGGYSFGVHNIIKYKDSTTIERQLIAEGVIKGTE